MKTRITIAVYKRASGKLANLRRDGGDGDNDGRGDCDEAFLSALQLPVAYALGRLSANMALQPSANSSFFRSNEPCFPQVKFLSILSHLRMYARKTNCFFSLG